jgi:polyisoprenoid-binding protein YceI
VNAGFVSRCLLVGAIVVALAPVQSPAAEWHVELDPARTRVTFTLKATLHTVDGSARLASGSLVVDTDTGTVSGAIIVDAASAGTGNMGRDKKMHSKVLQSDDHPKIVLRPQSIEGPITSGPATEVVLVGELFVLDSQHSITVPLTVRIEDAGFSAEAEFTVPYVEWGLEDPSTFVLRVAKEVRVRVTTEGTITVGDGVR